MDNHNLPLNFQLNNKYNIKKVLGQGGFGITYLAEDTLLDIDVCIKELFISGNSTRGANMTVLTQNMKEFSFADFKDRFLQEAKQLARFGHPNIVRVMEFFEANNTAYVVMEYIAGKNLKDYIAENGVMTEQQALPMIHQLFDAVEEVHNAGMLHRDLKPDNILLTAKNRVVLIDFGSAREFTEGKTITQTAMLTPGFAPIEQYSNRAKRGTFTDIYALGATMYYMLTGHKPIAATDRYREQLPAPHQVNPQISTQLSSAVMMAMEMKEEDRFQSVGDFRVALQQMVGGQKKKEEQKTVVIPKTESSKTVQNPETGKKILFQAYLLQFFLGLGFKQLKIRRKRAYLYILMIAYSWLSYINVFLNIEVFRSNDSITFLSELSLFHNKTAVGALSIFIGWFIGHVVGVIDLTLTQRKK
jgi:serine/threonine protein kinase